MTAWAFSIVTLRFRTLTRCSGRSAEPTAHSTLVRDNRYELEPYGSVEAPAYPLFPTTWLTYRVATDPPTENEPDAAGQLYWYAPACSA